MKIKYATDDDKHRWNDFVHTSENGSFYHLFEWKTVFEKEFKHQTYYMLGTEADRVVGILPLVQLKGVLFGNIICSLPFLNYGGVVSTEQKYESAFFQEIKNLMLNEQPDYIELRQKYKTSLNLPFKEHKVSMTVSLEPDPEKIWTNYSSKLRTSIRKAQKNGLVVEKGSEEYLNDFYRLISIGWRNLGTPVYRRTFFHTILKELYDFIDIFVLKYQNQIVGVAFNGKYKSTVEGMWTYVLPEIKKMNGNYLLYWEMIKQACLDGYTIFHLGRSSKDSGGEFFKKKWNAYSHQLYWEYIMNESDQLPDISVNNPKYQLYMNIWKKLPLKLTQWIGPPVAKYIP